MGGENERPTRVSQGVAKGGFRRIFSVLTHRKSQRRPMGHEVAIAMALQAQSGGVYANNRGGSVGREGQHSQVPEMPRLHSQTTSIIARPERGAKQLFEILPRRIIERVSSGQPG